MRAAWYEQTGAARVVLKVGTMELPVSGSGELQVRVHWSAVNLTDVKRHADASGPLPFPPVVPRMDASGIVEAVGAGSIRGAWASGSITLPTVARFTASCAAATSSS